jgi:hypothetical protein
MWDLVEDKHSIKLIESIEELAAVHESGIGRFCCKSPFPLLTQIFLGC